MLKISILQVSGNQIKITDGQKEMVVTRQQLDEKIKENKVEICQIVKVKCIDKQRDKNNVITAYLLSDLCNKQMAVTPEQLKNAIFNYQVDCVNLTLTSDNRLVDKSEECIEPIVLKVSIIEKYEYQSVIQDDNKNKRTVFDAELIRLMNEGKIEVEGYKITPLGELVREDEYAKKSKELFSSNYINSFYIKYINDSSHIGIAKTNSVKAYEYTEEEVKEALLKYKKNITGAEIVDGVLKIQACKFPAQEYKVTKVADNKITCIGVHDRQQYVINKSEMKEILPLTNIYNAFLENIRLIKVETIQELLEGDILYQLYEWHFNHDINQFMHKVLDLGYCVSMTYNVNCYPKIGYYPLEDGFLIKKIDKGYKIVIGAYRNFKKNGEYGDDIDMFAPLKYEAKDFTITRKSSETVLLTFKGTTYSFTYRYTTLRFI